MISAKWVFTWKSNELGKVVRAKTRLVARGFRQVEGVDYFEILPPLLPRVVFSYWLRLHVSLIWICVTSTLSQYSSSLTLKIMFLCCCSHGWYGQLVARMKYFRFRVMSSSRWSNFSVLVRTEVFYLDSSVRMGFSHLDAGASVTNRVRIWIYLQIIIFQLRFEDSLSSFWLEYWAEGFDLEATFPFDYNSVSGIFGLVGALLLLCSPQEGCS